MTTEAVPKMIDILEKVGTTVNQIAQPEIQKQRAIQRLSSERLRKLTEDNGYLNDRFAYHQRDFYGIFNQGIDLMVGATFVIVILLILG